MRGRKWGSKNIGPGQTTLGSGYVPKPAPMKASKTEILPNRHALATFLKGDPAQRTIGDYSKVTPTGKQGPARYADVVALGNMYGKK